MVNGLVLIYNVLTSERSGSSTLKELMNEEKRIDGRRLVNQKVQMISEDEGRAPTKSGRWSR